jgi:phenylalanyl-tRNA synthetase beta chain
MKIALDWIADYLSPVPAAEVAADALMNAGLPVESIVEAAGSQGATKVLDVEVTSNRTDCFSHVGLARELSALCGGVFSSPMIALAETGAPVVTTVAVEDAVGCPYYSARVIRNVKVGPSPAWMVKRLEAIGLRSINNVVDVTNYVLMELGQPLHAFDGETLAGQRIIVRRAKKQETFEAIDGKVYTLDPSMLVIADAERAVALAGIMGGKATEVTEKTTTIVLESARFEPLGIRTTSRALGLKSDSSYRFERGIDPAMAEVASRRAAQLIQQVAGGEVATGVVTVGAALVKPLTVVMRLKRFEEIVGITVSVDRMLSILSSLGFSPWVGEGGDAIQAKIPSHRLDVEREIDLIEEIARVYGYGHIPTLDRVSHPVRPEPASEKAGRAILGAMTEAGFSEAVTVSFLPEAEGGDFLQAGKGLIRTQHGGWKGDVLRPSLLPSLLGVRRTNQNAGIADARVFEKAEIIVQQGDAMKTAPTATRMLGAVAGDVAALSGLVRLLATKLNPAAHVKMEPAEFPFYVPGTCARVKIHAPHVAREVGHIGMFPVAIQRRYDLRHSCAGLELHWDSLVELFQPVRRATAVPRFPGIQRDLSIVIDEAVRWAEVEASIAGVHLSALENADFVTTFRNKSLGEQKKSLTLALNFRDAGRTLTNEEVDAQVGKVVGVLKETFGATLRV